MRIDLVIKLRSAVVAMPSWVAEELDLEPGDYHCSAIGPYQCTEDEATSYPVFVCELPDGRCFEVPVKYVQFVDLEE